MTTFSRLLEGMVVQILSRLPAKSILRFRSVSKLWFSLMNNPGFVTKHLSDHSRHNDFASYSCIFFKRTLLKDRTITDEEEIAEAYKDSWADQGNIDVLLSLLYIYKNDGDDNDLKFVVEDLPVRVNPTYIQITGCCDGIVCLNNIRTDNIVLCNPAIKESKLLPKSVLLFDLSPTAEDEDALQASTDAVGFGYDPLVKEYKVVRVVEFYSTCSTRVEVYTLGASDWREIETETMCNVSWASFINLYVKGIFYWWGSTETEGEIIISFDMSNEMFTIISLPEPSNQTDVFLNRRLVVWKETVAFFTPESELQIYLQMWVMNDFPGYNSSWTKHLSVGPFYTVELPLVLWESDEVATVDTNGRIVSRNLHTERLKYLPVNGVEEPYCIQAVSYVDSIISLKGDSDHENTCMY